MDYDDCPQCGAKLKVYLCDTTPGCRDFEEVICPVCKSEVRKVFTSGNPIVEVLEEKSSGQ